MKLVTRIVNRNNKVEVGSEAEFLGYEYVYKYPSVDKEFMNRLHKAWVVLLDDVKVVPNLNSCSSGLKQYGQKGRYHYIATGTADLDGLRFESKNAKGVITMQRAMTI